MFPINFNFPYRKKDGSLITMEKALDGAGADLDLIDLDDVAITTPVDGDGLIYDGSASKWKNIPIISRITALYNAWKNNGSYNLAPNIITTYELNGVTFTTNSDGSITANGTTTDETYLRTALKFTVGKTGTYKFFGTPNGLTSVSTLLVAESGGTTIATSSNETGVSCSLTAGTEYGIYIYIANGVTITNKTFKIMLTADLNATFADYVPYAMTNRELTEKMTSRYQMAKQMYDGQPFIAVGQVSGSDDGWAYIELPFNVQPVTVNVSDVYMPGIKAYTNTDIIEFSTTEGIAKYKIADLANYKGALFVSTITCNY